MTVAESGEIRAAPYGNVVATGFGLRKLVKVLLVSGATLVTAIFGGPVLSGAVFLLLPGGAELQNHSLPEAYQPLHKGAVDFATGLYVREDEDLIVDGTPALILRRTYLSGYRTSKQFGIGTTHNGEIYLHGDLQRISLIEAKGSRITFDRTSAGNSYLNAMFEHFDTWEWAGARLGWAGFGWALRRYDGNLLLFQGCGPTTVCSIIQARDADGHTIHYRRDKAGRLARMEAADRWIAFDYDEKHRIARARASTGRSVAYEYDSSGRLVRVAADDGRVHRYSYSDKDEMATIVDPGRTIENRYDANGRCVGQTVRSGGEPEPLTFRFSYRLEGNAVIETEMVRSDGEWSQHRFSRNRSVMSEKRGRPGMEPTHIAYDRDPETDVATAVTVTCPDRKGLPLRHTSLIHDGDDERVTTNLLSTHCFSRKRQ